jgi:hypothetical protein
MEEISTKEFSLVSKYLPVALRRSLLFDFMFPSRLGRSWRMNKLPRSIIQIIKSLFVVWNKLLLLCAPLHWKDASSSQRPLIHLSLFHPSSTKNERKTEQIAQNCVNKERLK